MTLHRRSVLAGLAAAPMAACGATEVAAGGARVFAAASLLEVLQEAAQAHVVGGAATPVFNFAGSSVLARQIEQGAEADLFISADGDWVDYLAERSLVASASRRPLAGNTLVLAVPAARDLAGLTSLADLPNVLGGERLAIGDPASVPAGRYAREALTAAGVWGALDNRLALGDTVRAALALVESGEAGAAIVYRTDALAAGARVRVVQDIAPGMHAPIVYWLAQVLRPDVRAGEAAGFAGFLLSETGQALFAARGFTPPPG